MGTVVKPAIPQDNLIQPGRDDPASTQNLQQGIEAVLKLAPGSTQPVIDLHPLKPEVEEILPELSEEKEGFSEKIEDLVGALGFKESGSLRTEPSKNFLKVFLSRLKKQHPDQMIREED